MDGTVGKVGLRSLGGGVASWTPANVRVSVDPGALGPVQGTNVFPIVLETNAVNIPREAEVFTNVRDVDQKGTLYTVPGRFVDIVADRFRDRFYVLDQEGFQVLVFDGSFRLGGRISVGNTPTWMLVSPDGGFLIVANAQSETMTLINLNTLRVETTIFLPWESLGGGRYPLSLAADAGNILLTMQSSDGGGEIGMFNLHNKIVTNPDTLGIFTNSFSPDSAVVGAPDGSGVLIAESTGGVHFWEALSSRITLTRDELPGLSGAIGAGANFFLVDNHVLNASLVEIAALPGAEAGQASAGFAVLPDSTAVRSISSAVPGRYRSLAASRSTRPDSADRPGPDGGAATRAKQSLVLLSVLDRAAGRALGFDEQRRGG